MKRNLTTFAMTALLLTGTVSVSADNVESHILHNSLNDSHQLSPSLIEDDQLSTMRAQGFHLHEVETGVILWDEVDQGSKPKTHHFGNDGVISITVE